MSRVEVISADDNRGMRGRVNVRGGKEREGKGGLGQGGREKWRRVFANPGATEDAIPPCLFFL